MLRLALVFELVTEQSILIGNGYISHLQTVVFLIILVVRLSHVKNYYYKHRKFLTIVSMLIFVLTMKF
jgi:hypothetical protein